MNLKNLTRIWFGLILCLLMANGLSPTAPVFGQETVQNPKAIILTIKGPLTPVLVEYTQRGLDYAEEVQAELIVLQLDTPGGSIDLMNRIVQQIRSSRTPVIVYVAPRGAIAGSAGTVITLAGHLSAMAPETAIGAASPVGMQGENIETTLETKTKEILKASVRAIAADRSPAAIALAEETIESAKAVSVNEAFEVGLIDLVAEDLQDLLEQLDGRIVRMGDEEKVLHSQDTLILPVEYTFIEEILQLLTNPNIVFILLSIGVQAILIEISNPGGWFAGFLGASLLLLATYGLGILPVNWFGILFLVLAFVLFILDIKAPTHGALTAAGAASFITGALVLFNSASLPGFPRVSVPLVIGTGILFAATFFAIVTFALMAQRTPVKTGKESLPGQIGIARTAIDPTGQVHAAGELWSAELSQGEMHMERGDAVEIVTVNGLNIVVRRVP
jgi:membrane-bound serine protease (ClpP class)